MASAQSEVPNSNCGYLSSWRGCVVQVGARLRTAFKFARHLGRGDARRFVRSSRMWFRRRLRPLEGCTLRRVRIRPGEPLEPLARRYHLVMNAADIAPIETPVRWDPTLPISASCGLIGDEYHDLTARPLCLNPPPCPETDACESRAVAHSGAHPGPWYSLPSSSLCRPPDQFSAGKNVAVTPSVERQRPSAQRSSMRSTSVR
jgi:hypothetical protein